MCLDPHLNSGYGCFCETGLSRSSKIIYTDRSKAVLFCGSFVFFVSCVSHVFTSVHCCLLVTCWERADLLAFVGDVYCMFATFPCGVVLNCIVA